MALAFLIRVLVKLLVLFGKIGGARGLVEAGAEIKKTETA